MSNNYYDILNLNSDCSKKDIKKAYKKLAKIYHPDQLTGNLKYFELITKAYNTLVNTKSRNEYDQLNSVNLHNNTFLNLKQKYKDFIDNNSLLYDETVAKKKFDVMFKECNNKHQFSLNNLSSNLNADINKFDDIKLFREQQDIENTPKKIIHDTKNFNNKFNNFWNNSFKKSFEIIPHTGDPHALVNITDSYTSINNYDKLYDSCDSDDNNNTYTSLKLLNKLSKKNNKHVINSDINSDYSSHNNLDSNYTSHLDDKINQHLNEIDNYNSSSLQSKFSSLNNE